MCNQSPIMNTKVLRSEFETIAISTYNQKNHKNICSFEKIDISELAKNCNGNAIYCPDQYVGIINIEKDDCVSSWNVGWVEESVSKKTQNDRETKSKEYENNKLPVLAIVLESPHQQEFAQGIAIGPAIRTTGDNIEKYLTEVVFNYLPSKKNNSNISYEANNQIPNDRYKVLLINAIQYQCSLGEATKQNKQKTNIIYRDDVFAEMWKNVNVKQDFIDRLKSHNPKIVINACTSTGDKDRKPNVQKAINDCEININLKSPHPSSWHDKKNRYIIKVK